MDTFRASKIRLDQVEQPLEIINSVVLIAIFRALTAQKAIARGEEVLVNYMMTLAKSPDWYRCVWIQHMRVVKKGDDKAIQR